MTPDGRAEVFVDTSAFFAVFNADDIHHVDLSGDFARLMDEGRLVTTSLVVAETHALLLSKVGRDVALRVLEGFYTSRLTIIRITDEDETEARSILRRYADKTFSYADALSFVVMVARRITVAMTLDRHFAQYGFLTIPILG